MIRRLTPIQVRRSHLLGEELALLDLREEYHFAFDHPLLASNLPLSRLELEAPARLPNRHAPIVVYDDAEGFADLGAQRLTTLGYDHVAVLRGGLQAWREAGYELFQDVNSYSKAFGELVEARRHTPSLSAEELHARQQRGEDLVILDSRRFDEYRTMSIPGGVSAPGAELVLKAAQAAPDPATPVVVNCAGRTRSLIGAQSLINAGLPNPVFALRNGAIGWQLAGQTLDQCRDLRAPEPAPERIADALSRARDVSYRAGVRVIDADALAQLESDPERTLYRFDVRPPEAYVLGRPPRFLSAPGGQLVQETDAFAPVRGARIVLWDDTGVRAHMTASWLAQMAWTVFVLEGPAPGGLATAPAVTPAEAPEAPGLTVDDLAEALERNEAALIDLDPSPVYRRGHIPGARFAIRSRLATDVAKLPVNLVLTSSDGRLARWAAADLAAIGVAARVVQGGTQAWRAAERPLVGGDGDPFHPFEDVYRRPYEGADHPAAAMQAYLDWEFGLVEQLRRDGAHGFFVI